MEPIKCPCCQAEVVLEPAPDGFSGECRKCGKSLYIPKDPTYPPKLRNTSRKNLLGLALGFSILTEITATLLLVLGILAIAASIFWSFIGDFIGYIYFGSLVVISQDVWLLMSGLLLIALSYILKLLRRLVDLSEKSSVKPPIDEVGR